MILMMLGGATEDGLRSNDCQPTISAHFEAMAKFDGNENERNMVCPSPTIENAHYIRATEVECLVDDEGYGVRWYRPFCEKFDKRGWFELDRAMDSESGTWKSVVVSRCRLGWMCHGGVEGVVLLRNSVAIRLISWGRGMLRCSDLVIEFKVDNAEFAEMLDAMNFILADLDEFVVEN